MQTKGLVLLVLEHGQWQEPFQPEKTTDRLVSDLLKFPSSPEKPNSAYQVLSEIQAYENEAMFNTTETRYPKRGL